MMSIATMREILADVEHPGYSFEVHTPETYGTAAYLQAVFMAPDHDQPSVCKLQRTRKWLLSRHMTRSELVQTAFKCVLTATEHEAREQFTYKGARVFGPHFDVIALVEACVAERTEARMEAP